MVDSKLRHTHPRVQKQRAAAANLAAAVAASTAASVAASMEEYSTDPTAAGHEPGTSSSQQDAAAVTAAAVAAAASSNGKGIQVVQVLPSADPSSSTVAAAGQGGQGEVLLELDGVSINTPDGGLALVQNLNIKVSEWVGEWVIE